METQREYLTRLGLWGSDDFSKVEKAKIAYRKRYKRYKNREYYRTRCFVRLRLLPKEKKILSIGAKNHKQPLAKYVREIALAYQRKVYVLPDKQQLHNLEIGFRRIGNNINQVARICNARQEARYNDVVVLQQQLIALEKLVTSYLIQPMTLENLVKVELAKRPDLLATVKKLIQNNGMG